MSQPCLPVRRKRGRDQEPSSVAEEGFDDSQIQSMDAAEYLARVVKQAKGMPDVHAAPPDDSRDSKGNTISSKHREFVPIDGSAASLSYLVSERASLTPVPTTDHLPRNSNPAVWIRTTISNFEKLRTYLETARTQGIGGKKTDRIPLPPMKDRSGWHIFCVGRNEARGNVDSYFGDDDDDVDIANSNELEDTSTQDDLPEWQKGMPADGHNPSVRLLTQIDQVLVRRVLSHLSHYMCEEGSTLTPQRSVWIYALLARLEQPIHRDDAAVLFGLLKALTRARSKLNAEHRKPLARLNVLIVLTGIYFEQGGSKEAGVMTFNEK
jgi:survival of motor neuron protein-interacting protein 1